MLLFEVVIDLVVAVGLDPVAFAVAAAAAVDLPVALPAS